MTVRPCSSTPTTLAEFPSDLRVNYAYGMVMGVDEFRQEQVHHVRRRRLDSRMLHGFGVAHGLEVRQTPLTDGDVELAIEPGMALDPLGREIIVRERQCLRLNEWLKANASAARPHIDDGRLTLCITARYRECLERQVPVPGVPCATEEENRTHSRIRESFRLRLELDAPPQPGEEITRRFGEIFDRVEIDPDLAEDETDEDALIAHIEALGTDAEPTGASWYRLPFSTARDALRRVFRAWTARVRPRFVALDEPNGNGNGNGNGTTVEEPPVLLGYITFTLDDTGTHPIISGDISIDADARPVLLDTRTIQELIQSWTALLRRDVREFATLYADEPELIRVWLHHPEPLTIPLGAVQLVVTTGDVESNVGISAIEDTADPQVKRLRTNGAIPTDAWIGVGFNIDDIDTPSGVLGTVIDEERVTYATCIRRELWAYTAFEGASPVRRLASVRCVSERALEVWFHTDMPVDFRNERPVLIRPDGRADVSWEPVGEQGRSFVWLVRLPDGDRPFEDGDRMALRFNPGEILHGEPHNRLLSSWIDETETTFAGEQDDGTIYTTHVLSCIETAVTKPTVSFAEICRIERDVIRAWLHFDAALEFVHAEDAPAVSILINGRDVGPLRIETVDIAGNVFDFHFSNPRWSDPEGDRIEIEFRTDRIRVRTRAIEGLRRGASLSLSDLAHETPARPIATAPLTLADVRRFSPARAITDALRIRPTERLLFERNRQTLKALLPDLDVVFLNHVGDSLYAFLLDCCCDPRVCLLGTVDAIDARTIRVWFHTDEPLMHRVGTKSLRVAINEGPAHPVSPVINDPSGFARAWLLDLPRQEQDLRGGEHIRIELSTFDVFAGSTDRRLADVLRARGHALVCDDAGNTELHGTADLALAKPKDQPTTPTPGATGELIEFATIRDLPPSLTHREPGLRFIAALLLSPRAPDVDIVPDLTVALEVDDGRDTQLKTFPLEVRPLIDSNGKPRRNILDLRLDESATKEVARIGSELGPLMLRFDFDLTEIQLRDARMSVSEYARNVARVRFIGSYVDRMRHEHAVAYVLQF